MLQEEDETRESEVPLTKVPWPSVALVPAAIFSSTFLILAWALLPKMLADRQSARILREGVDAKARVTSVVATGSYYNEEPEVVISLEVTPAEGEPYSSTLETHLSPVHLPRVQPGSIVDVRFDPNSPEDVALVVN